MKLTYLSTDFRERFASTLGPRRGGFAADVEDLGQWCADALEVIGGEGELSEYFGDDPMHALQLVAAQTTIINCFLRGQGFAPPVTIDTYNVDPMGMLSAVSSYYLMVAPLVHEPKQSIRELMTMH